MFIFLTISIQEVQLWYISGKITLYQVTVGKLDGNFCTGYLQVPHMCLPTCNVLNFRAIKAINKHGLHWKRTQLIGPQERKMQEHKSLAKTNTKFNWARSMHWDRRMEEWMYSQLNVRALILDFFAVCFLFLFFPFRLRFSSWRLLNIFCSWHLLKRNLLTPTMFRTSWQIILWPHSLLLQSEIGN